MKILNPQSATLSNYEVFAHLVSRREASIPPSTTVTATLSSSEKKSTRDRDREREKPQQRKLKAPNYEAVSREILEYLSPGSTASTHPSNHSTQPSTNANTSTSTRADKTYPLPSYGLPRDYSADNIAALLEALSAYDLTKAELLMIVNLRPRDAASLDAVVEEVDDRFDEGTQNQILDVIRRCIGER